MLEIAIKREMRPTTTLAIFLKTTVFFRCGFVIKNVMFQEEIGDFIFITNFLHII